MYYLCLNSQTLRSSALTTVLVTHLFEMCYLCIDIVLVACLHIENVLLCKVAYAENEFYPASCQRIQFLFVLDEWDTTQQIYDIERLIFEIKN